MKIQLFRLSVFFSICFIFSLSSCARSTFKAVGAGNPDYKSLMDNKNFKKANSEMDTIIGIESVLPSPSKQILATGRKMALDDKTIIKGSCWDWINEVFNRAGYGTNKKVIYKSKKNGPYVDINLIKPGDWLYYVNYSYHGIEHSGIFIYWKDFEKKIGVILSYGGRNRNETGRYLSYNLKSVYYITRAVEN
jgi:hypothetical protein